MEAPVEQAELAGSGADTAGLKAPSSRLLRLVSPVRWMMRRYITTDDGLARPWSLLEQSVDGWSDERLVLGAMYLGVGSSTVHTRRRERHR